MYFIPTTYLKITTFKVLSGHMWPVTTISDSNRGEPGEAVILVYNIFVVVVY